MKKIFVLLLMFLVTATMSNSIFAQVTTGSISGVIKSKTGELLQGASISAIHTPSGTVYNIVSKKNGNYTLQGLRVGGPYTIKVDYVGQKQSVFENIYISLGDTYLLDIVMGVEDVELEGVMVTGNKKRQIKIDNGGVSTVVSNKLLSTLPTISRSITDFTRLTPEANGSSFGGRDGRFNNITIDGANLNNNFGLSSDPLPGAGNNPVSLDAIEATAVSIADYDVRQGNYTGGNIAAITKSGTNTFHGSAYYYVQNQDLIGYNIKNSKASKVDFSSKIYGGTLGGYIIKNKLFFFLNGEYEKKPPAAGISYTPTGGSGTGNISTVTAADLKRVNDYVVGLGYNPGAYDNFPAFKNSNYKILGKIDWNITKSHKLSFKYSDFKGTQDFQPSQSASINGANSYFTPGAKFSNIAMSFFGSTYSQVDKVRSYSLELNSSFHNKFSNKFLATYTNIFTDKTANSSFFPFVDIVKDYDANQKNNYISVGNEPFNGNNNKVLNDIYTITDNFSAYLGKHTLTGGLSYEYQKVGNMFMRGSNGYYLFKNVNDFVTNQNPVLYTITYAYDKNVFGVYSAQLQIGQLAAYLQDEFNINQNFKLTYGIRLDKPIYPEQPRENPYLTSLTFADYNGNPAKFTTGQWPKASALYSPRVSFRWDVKGDKTKIIRGGTGIFTGRIPFVFLTNIPTNSGMYQNGVLLSSSNANMSLYKFNKDPYAYNPAFNTLDANLFPMTAGTSSPADVVFTTKNFKFPQVWKTNLGWDQTFGNGWKSTLEVIYSKDLNAIFMYNANQKQIDGTVTQG